MRVQGYEAELSGNHIKAVAFCVDDNNFVPALLAANRIACLSTARDFDIVIASQTPLSVPREFSELGIRNEILRIADDLRDIGIEQPWPAAAYLRLWLPREFAGNYCRILYMDADIYPMAADYGRLLDIDIRDHAFAAVLDKEQWLFPDEPILDLKNYGSHSTRYFNSGVMLIDVPRYNEADLLGRLVARYRRGVKSQFKDQAILNLVTEGDFAQFSPVWNWQWTHRYPMLTRLVRPNLLHLSGLPKPWTAHESATRFRSGLVEEYKDFFSMHDSKLAFETDRAGGLREPFLENITNLVGHLDVWSRLRRQMRDFSDPYRAKF